MSRFIQGIGLIQLLTVATAVTADTQPATESASLLLTPARCVALHQGQVCYQRVQISWRSLAQGDYCLYQETQPQPLRCWQQQTQGIFTFEFASDTAQMLQLKNGQQHVVAEATMEVAWVYKASTRRKTHWRLF